MKKRIVKCGETNRPNLWGEPNPSDEPNLSDDSTHNYVMRLKEDYLMRLKELTVGSQSSVHDLILPSELYHSDNDKGHTCRYFRTDYSHRYKVQDPSFKYVTLQDNQYGVGSNKFIPPFGFYNTMNLFFAIHQKLRETNKEGDLKITDSGFPSADNIMNPIMSLAESAEEDMRDMNKRADEFLEMENLGKNKKRTKKSALLKYLPAEVIQQYIRGAITLSDDKSWLKVSTQKVSTKMREDDEDEDTTVSGYRNYSGKYRYLDPRFYDVSTPVLITIDNNGLEIKSKGKRVDVFFKLFDFVKHDISYLFWCGEYDCKKVIEEYTYGVGRDYQYEDYNLNFTKNWVEPILDYLMTTRSKDGRIGFDSELKKLEDALHARELLRSLKVGARDNKHSKNNNIGQLEELTQAIRNYPEHDKMGQLAKMIYVWGWSEKYFSPYKKYVDVQSNFEKKLKSVLQGSQLKSETMIKPKNLKQIVTQKAIFF